MIRIKIARRLLISHWICRSACVRPHATSTVNMFVSSRNNPKAETRCLHVYACYLSLHTFETSELWKMEFYGVFSNTSNAKTLISKTPVISQACFLPCNRSISSTVKIVSVSRLFLETQSWNIYYCSKIMVRKWARVIIDAFSFFRDRWRNGSASDSSLGSIRRLSVQIGCGSAILLFIAVLLFFFLLCLQGATFVLRPGIGVEPR